MIPVIDCWTRVPPPPGGADDDELLSASGRSAVIIGDRGARERAERMGVGVITHIAVRSPGGFAPAIVRRRLESFDTSRLSPRSIWAAGCLRSAVVGEDPPTNPVSLAPRSGLRPFVLPIASNPGSVDACLLVAAQALVEAAGNRCLLGLPSGACQVDRARRQLAAADRLLAIEALGHPAPMYVGTADLVIDLGVNPGGSIDALIREAGVPRVTASGSTTPLALASFIHRGLLGETDR